MSISSHQFVVELTDSGVLLNADVSEFIERLPIEERENVDQLAAALVRHAKLTSYQVDQTFAGNAKTLVLGNYIILDRIGKGGMGLVLKARHRRMERIVALKVLSPDLTKTASVVQRFHREARAAARLEHPNIVTAYDADEACGTHFLVMQFVDGQDLHAYVKTVKRLPLTQAIDYLLQAAEALHYAHSLGVIHRDIKPSNILRDGNDRVKILDLGLARIDTEELENLTATNTTMGTVDFMAPEQAIDAKRADARSDIYSLGVTLWFLLTGRSMYERDTITARLLAHQTAPIPSLRSDCPFVCEQLDAIFRRMVAKSPTDRYASMDEVIYELRNWQSNLQTASSACSSNGPTDTVFDSPFGMVKKKIPSRDRGAMDSHSSGLRNISQPVVGVLVDDSEHDHTPSPNLLSTINSKVGRAETIVESPQVVGPVKRSAVASLAGWFGLSSPLVVTAPFALILGVLALRELGRNPQKSGRFPANFAVIMGFLFSLPLFLLVSCWLIVVVSDGSVAPSLVTRAGVSIPRSPSSSSSQPPAPNPAPNPTASISRPPTVPTSEPVIASKAADSTSALESPANKLKALTNEAEKLIGALENFQGPLNERRQLLAKTYESIALVCSLAEDNLEALRPLKTRIVNSSIIEDIRAAGDDWYRFEGRKNLGIVLVGTGRYDPDDLFGSPYLQITLHSGIVIEWVVEMPQDGKYLVLGKLSGGKNLNDNRYVQVFMVERLP